MTYTSWASSQAARATMVANKGRNTGPEVSLRKKLHGAGLRFRINYPVPDLPRRTIDIAFPRRRVAVFVDGCYWHGCRIHRTIPETNREFWLAKINATTQRDVETAEHLETVGWAVMRFWEHDSLDDVVVKIAQTVGARV